MPLPAAVEELVARYKENRSQYLSGHYNETETRVDFVNPLFAALGWDMNNRGGLPEAYRQVVHEDAIKIGGTTKAPDYSFRVGGQRKFFLETKKPTVVLNLKPEPSYQLRRYAWTAKMPVSILTNFEEFAVYDGRVAPDHKDSPKKARLDYFKYTDYAQRWDELAARFSQTAVEGGAFDKYAEGAALFKASTPVDAAFLTQISVWRETLAQNIARNNPALGPRDLNFAVQMIIDRLIFLRICEDRGVESEHKLQPLLNGPRAYPRLLELFHQADDRYNSGLFHFQPEKGRADFDAVTPGLTIDDRTLKEIIASVYYPESPFEFSVFPADILGQVYEQFLGQVIRLTDGHRAVIEDKPEVKKAGGVYYTPTYIVDYIVQQTVGKLVEGKTPKQVAALRILDPACGSGSFLLGAYQFLIDWHRDWYLNDDPAKWQKGKAATLYQAQGGVWRLTTAEKKRILLNNIHGVDIDTQAVEVTKLSLLLKVLEGESVETVNSNLKLFKERALPTLERNIKCGNSLIGPDFYADPQRADLDMEAQLRVNCFDWQTEFAEIMKNGGFDAVIGNPPYIFTRNQGIGEDQKAYYYKNYKHQSAQLNTFGIFVERSFSLMGFASRLGFIIPNNWLTIDSFSALRKFILTEAGEVKVINIRDRVFTLANVDTAIVMFNKQPPTNITIGEMKEKTEVFCQSVQLSVVKPPAYIIQISLMGNVNSQSIIEKIEACSRPLKDFCTVSTGLKAYQIGKGSPLQTEHEKKGRIFHSVTQIDSSFQPYLDGVDVRRYSLAWSGQYLRYGDWLAEPRKSVPFAGPRILVRQIPSKQPYLVNGAFVDEVFYNDINSMVIFRPYKSASLKYLLGCVNSRLMSFWFSKIFDKLQRKIFPQFKVKELASFPIYPVNFDDLADKARHDAMVTLVERMLTLNKDLPGKTGQERAVTERQIAATDGQIDALVYELYGLTAEEIKVVEG